MSTVRLAERVYVALNQELLRRQLIRYFVQKGFKESFNRKLYPPQLQDMTMHVPILDGKVEVTPFVEDIDPNSGVVTLGWNLFVLGNKRMYLGESTHTSLVEITNFGIGQAPPEADHTTPRRVMNFVIKILSEDKRGVLRRQKNQRGNRAPMPGFGMGDVTGHFFSKQKFV